jgi:hypothetical protein
MAHTRAQPGPLPEALEKGYEPHDLKASWIVWFVVIFIVIAALIQIGLWVLLVKLGSTRREVDAPRSVLTAQEPAPSPSIQPTQQHDALPAEDLQAMRKQEDAVFSQLGWDVNPQTHQVIVPDDVVKRVAQGQPGGAR